MDGHSGHIRLFDLQQARIRIIYFLIFLRIYKYLSCVNNQKSGIVEARVTDIFLCIYPARLSL